MTRYRVLRNIGCDPLAAALISFLNAALNVPPGLVGFMNIVIEYDPRKGAGAKENEVKRATSCATSLAG